MPLSCSCLGAELLISTECPQLCSAALPRGRLKQLQLRGCLGPGAPPGVPRTGGCSEAQHGQQQEAALVPLQQLLPASVLVPRGHLRLLCRLLLPCVVPRALQHSALLAASCSGQEHAACGPVPLLLPSCGAPRLLRAECCRSRHCPCLHLLLVALECHRRRQERLSCGHLGRGTLHCPALCSLPFCRFCGSGPLGARWVPAACPTPPQGTAPRGASGWQRQPHSAPRGLAEHSVRAACGSECSTLE